MSLNKEFKSNQLNIRLQNITNLAMFNTIYLNEELVKGGIRSEVCEFEPQITTFNVPNASLFEWVICEQHITSGYHTQLWILQCVQYLATSRHNQQFFSPVIKGFINPN